MPCTSYGTPQAHIFTKLGITTRAELAAQATSRNLTAK
jgi:DNA-binding CsgD family transcriptional regulator